MVPMVVGGGVLMEVTARLFSNAMSQNLSKVGKKY